MPIAWPDGNMRGPGTKPASIACMSATSANPPAPTSRTVVKPARSVIRAFAAPRSAQAAGVPRTGSAEVAGIGEIAGQMGVEIDETGEQRDVAELDDARVGRHRTADPLDPLAADHDDAGPHDPARRDIQQPRRADDGDVLGARRSRGAQHGEEREVSEHGSR